jgi:DNA-binding transcriptional MocR family regulator
LQSAGWVEATVGRGTFVCDTAQNCRLTSAIGKNLTPDAVINDIVQLDQIAGVRSMASASPDPALFPAQEFWAQLNGLSPDAIAMAGYSSSQGDPDLRVQLTNWVGERGVQAAPDDILVTAGATQALALVAQALTRPGDTVVVEQPTYLGLLHTLKAQGLQPIGVPVDADGPRLDILERIIVQQRPRFFYTIPNYQNPTGYCASDEQQRRLIDLSERYGFMLVEDDIYSRLAYDGPLPSTLKSLDRSGLVVHVGSFSKLFAPGLRLGYVVAPSPLNAQLLSLRRGADLCSPPLLQRALAGFLDDGGMRRHLRRTLPIYRKRRDALVSALQRYMPPAVNWTEPQGGFCSWITLPRLNTFNDLQQAALHRGWAFAPGEAILAQPDGHQHLRICFGHQHPGVIRDGVAVLAGLIQERLIEDAPESYQVQDWTPLV